MADDPNQDADETARNQAALAAYDRQRGSLRDRLAAFQERQRNENGNADQVSQQGRGGGWQQMGRHFGPPLPQPRLEDAAGDLGPPPPPQSVTDTANAFAAATQAMTAIAENLGKRNNSRGRDGDIVIHKDISQVFEEVPVEILERVKYVKRVANRLSANTSGILMKIHSQDILSIRVEHDSTVPSNYRMCTFEKRRHGCTFCSRVF